MKKIIFLASVFVGVSMNSIGQVTPSSFLVGANSNFSLGTNKNGDVDRIQFSLQPSLGKFVSDKWMTNFGLGYSMMYSKNGSLNRSNSNQFSGTFGMTRYYPMSEKFYLTLNYSIGAGYEKTRFSFSQGQDSLITNGVNETASAQIFASPGLTYFLTRKWMLFSSFGGLGYSFNTSIVDFAPVHSIGYSFQANSFGVGARYVFGTEK